MYIHVLVKVGLATVVNVICMCTVKPWVRKYIPIPMALAIPFCAPLIFLGWLVLYQMSSSPASVCLPDMLLVNNTYVQSAAAAAPVLLRPFACIGQLATTALHVLASS